MTTTDARLIQRLCGEFGDCNAVDAVRSHLSDLRAELADVEHGCPCLLVVPCHRQCSCAYPGMSAGCRRCARYGSLEQRKRAAMLLAGRAKVVEAARGMLVGMCGTAEMRVRATQVLQDAITDFDALTESEVCDAET